MYKRLAGGMLCLLFSMNAGCATYRPLELSNRAASESASGDLEAGSPGEGAALSGAVAKDRISRGAELRITLHGGEVVKGAVVRVTEQAIVFGKVGNYGFEETAVEFADIDRIEARQEGKVAAFAAGTIGAAVIGFLGLAILFAASWGPG